MINNSQYYVLILGLILSGCVPLTPAQHVRNLKFEIGAVRLGCAVYQLDMKYPRDSSLDMYCPRLNGK